MMKEAVEPNDGQAPMDEDPYPKLYNTLLTKGRAALALHGFDVEIGCCDAEMRFVTAVFSGGNYIPQSVRQALELDHGASKSAFMKLVIDENHFHVLLYYRLQIAQLTSDDLRQALQEFLGVAAEWRWMLDEYGQQDLVYVAVRS